MRRKNKSYVYNPMFDFIQDFFYTYISSIVKSTALKNIYYNKKIYQNNNYLFKII